MYIKIPCDQVSFELKKWGSIRLGLPSWHPRRLWNRCVLIGVRAPGANIIKQEMLAMGADAANAKGTINCSIERTDVILLGSRTQYRHLAHKLRANQGWFGLDEVIRDIEDYLTDHELATILADGRTLTYEKMRIMGILNVTPDSFYSGSRVTAGSLILKRAGKMLDDGADVLILAVNRPALAVIPYRQKKSAVSSGLFRKSAGLILRPSFPLIRTTLRRPAPPLTREPISSTMLRRERVIPTCFPLPKKKTRRSSSCICVVRPRP